MKNKIDLFNRLNWINRLEKHIIIIICIFKYTQIGKIELLTSIILLKFNVITRAQGIFHKIYYINKKNVVFNIKKVK